MKWIIRILVYLALISATQLSLTSCSQKKQERDYTAFYQEIKSGNKMVFASMALTKTVSTERTDWYKVGKRIAVYSYDTHLKAYIDLSLIELDDIVFDEDTKTVKVTLPPVEIEIAGRDMKMRKEYENIGLLRTEIDAKERAKLKEMANEELMKELKENPEFKQKLTETARRKARSYFEALFTSSGYTPQISFSDDSPTLLHES